MSRILIWSPNYAPELTGIAPLVTHAAEWLAARGHDVHVVAPMPNYPERAIRAEYRGRLWQSELRGLVNLHRSWLRVRPNEGFLDKVLYELSYATVSLPQVLFRLRRVDSLVCVVPSLLAAGLAGTVVSPLRLAGRGIRYVVWLQDLVLEAAAVVRGVGPTAQRLLSLGRAFERISANTADCVAVCSPGFRDHLIRLGADRNRIVTVYNGVDVDEIGFEPPPSPSPPVGFLYLGNLGYTQDFDNLFAAFEPLGHTAELVLYGEGNASGHVRGLADRLDNVHLRSPVGWEILPEVLAAAHATVLAQRRGIAEANLPSKLAPYLAAGRPVVAAVDLDSPAARLLEDSRGALLVPPEDPRRLEQALRRVTEDESLRARLGRNAREFAVRRLSREATLGRLEQAILG